MTTDTEAEPSRTNSYVLHLSSADRSPVLLGCTCFKEDQLFGISSQLWEPKAQQSSNNNGLIRRLHMEGAAENDNIVDLTPVLPGPTFSTPTLSVELQEPTPQGPILRSRHFRSRLVGLRSVEASNSAQFAVHHRQRDFSHGTCRSQQPSRAYSSPFASSDANL